MINLITLNPHPLNYSLSRINSIAMGNPEAIARFNTLFIDQTINVDLPTLKQSANNGDWKNVSALAHKMKPSLDIYEINTGLEILRGLIKIQVSPDNCEEWMNKINHLCSELEQVKISLQTTT